MLSAETYAAGEEATSYLGVDVFARALMKHLCYCRSARSIGLTCLMRQSEAVMYPLRYRYTPNLTSLSLVFDRAGNFEMFMAASLKAGKFEAEPEKTLPKLRGLNLCIVEKPTMNLKTSPLEALPLRLRAQLEELVYNCASDKSVLKILPDFQSLRSLTLYVPEKADIKLLCLPHLPDLRKLIIHKAYFDSLELLGVLAANPGLEYLEVNALSIYVQNCDHFAVGKPGNAEDPPGVETQSPQRETQSFSLDGLPQRLGLRHLVINSSDHIPLDHLSHLLRFCNLLSSITIKNSIYISRFFLRKNVLKDISRSHTQPTTADSPTQKDVSVEECTTPGAEASPASSTAIRIPNEADLEAADIVSPTANHHLPEYISSEIRQLTLLADQETPDKFSPVHFEMLDRTEKRCRLFQLASKTGGRHVNAEPSAQYYRPDYLIMACPFPLTQPSVAYEQPRTRWRHKRIRLHSQQELHDDSPDSDEGRPDIPGLSLDHTDLNPLSDEHSDNANAQVNGSRTRRSILFVGDYTSKTDSFPSTSLTDDQKDQSCRASIDTVETTRSTTSPKKQRDGTRYGSINNTSKKRGIRSTSCDTPNRVPLSHRVSQALRAGGGLLGPSSTLGQSQAYSHSFGMPKPRSADLGVSSTLLSVYSEDTIAAPPKPPGTNPRLLFVCTASREPSDSHPSSIGASCCLSETSKLTFPTTDHEEQSTSMPGRTGYTPERATPEGDIHANLESLIRNADPYNTIGYSKENLMGGQTYTPRAPLSSLFLHASATPADELDLRDDHEDTSSETSTLLGMTTQAYRAKSVPIIRRALHRRWAGAGVPNLSTNIFGSHDEAWEALIFSYREGRNEWEETRDTMTLASLRTRIRQQRGRYEQFYLSLGYPSLQSELVPMSLFHRVPSGMEVKGPKQLKAARFRSNYQALVNVSEDSKYLIDNMQTREFQEHMKYYLKAIEPLFNLNLEEKPFFQTKTGNTPYIEKSLLLRQKLLNSAYGPGFRLESTGRPAGRRISECQIVDFFTANGKQPLDGIPSTGFLKALKKMIDLHDVQDVYDLPFNKTLLHQIHCRRFIDEKLKVPDIDAMVGRIIRPEELQEQDMLQSRLAKAKDALQECDDVTTDLSYTLNNTLLCNALLLYALSGEVRELHIPTVHLTIHEILFISRRFRNLRVLEIASLPTPTSSFKERLGAQLLRDGDGTFSHLEVLALRKGYMIDPLFILHTFSRLRTLELENCVLLNTITNERAFDDQEDRPRYCLERFVLTESLSTERIVLRNFLLLVRETLTSIHLSRTRIPLYNLWRGRVIVMPRLQHVVFRNSIYDEPPDLGEYFRRYKAELGADRTGSLCLLDMLAVILCYPTLVSLCFAQQHTIDYGGVYEYFRCDVVMHALDVLQRYAEDNDLSFAHLRTVSLVGGLEGDLRIFVRELSKNCDIGGLTAFAARPLLPYDASARLQGLDGRTAFGDQCALGLQGLSGTEQY